jgi:16S rRNA (guanine966-N2)-methyltransferase
MRIVAGRHRGRTIAAPAEAAVRPTTDRVRENLFNILAHGRLSAGDRALLDGATVLDAFAGSGALGLEALSRGAADAVFLDNELTALECIRRNAAALGEVQRSVIVQADASVPPTPAKVRGHPGPRSLLFLDPPYRSGLAAAALAGLTAAGWLAPAAFAVVELAAGEPLALPPGFTLADERRYGRTRVVFLSWDEASAVPGSS